MMKDFSIRKFHKDEKGYSLIELLVVIAIMVILVAIWTPMLFNSGSRKTQQDVKFFDAMLAKNAVQSMAKQNRALELGYDSTDEKYYVAFGHLEDVTSGGTTVQRFVAEDTQYFDKEETISYFMYESSDSTHDGSYRHHDADSGTVIMNHTDKIYFLFDKTKGNFKKAKIGTSYETAHDAGYVKYVYFTVKNHTRGVRLYKDSGKHDVFKEN